LVEDFVGDQSRILIDGIGDGPRITVLAEVHSWLFFSRSWNLGRTANQLPQSGAEILSGFAVSCEMRDLAERLWILMAPGIMRHVRRPHCGRGQQIAVPETLNQLLADSKVYGTK
jgi:hypothetical protein